MEIPDLARPGRPFFAAGMIGFGALALLFGDLTPGLQSGCPHGRPSSLDRRLLRPVHAGPWHAAALAQAVGPSGLRCGWRCTGSSGPWSPPLPRAGSSTWWGGCRCPRCWAWPPPPGCWPRRRTPRAGPPASSSAPCSSGSASFTSSTRAPSSGMIPDWMPARDFWPYVTAAANIAGDWPSLTGVLGRLGSAPWSGLMFASWIFLVHIPRADRRRRPAARSGQRWP